MAACYTARSSEAKAPWMCPNRIIQHHLGSSWDPSLPLPLPMETRHPCAADGPVRRVEKRGRSPACPWC